MYSKNYFLHSEMTTQLRHTQQRHAQHRHTMLPMEDIVLNVDDVGISLEHLPNSLLQGNFLEFGPRGRFLQYSIKDTHIHEKKISLLQTQHQALFIKNVETSILS